jgi:hypothetical protein
MNGTVLMNMIDSEVIDDLFHNQPIYGRGSMLSKKMMTVPKRSMSPQSIHEKIDRR